MTYWFPWQHFFGVTTGARIWHFWPPHAAKKWALRLGPTGPRRRSVLPPTKQPQPNYLLGPSGLAIFRNGLPSQKPQPKRTVRYSPLERRKCTSPQFFALSMSVPRPRTCRAQLRPRRVLQLGSLVFSCCF